MRRGASAPAVPGLTAPQVIDLLRARHAAPSWAFVENVCESTANNRRCDAMAVGQWHSVGQNLHGFEVKVARSDWLREMQDPAKAETFARFCDFWWIVAAEGIVRLEEMPEHWGLMEAVGEGLKVRRPATKREPEPLSRGLLVMLTRRAAQQCPEEAALKAARQEGYDDGYKHGADSTLPRYEHDRLVEAVEKFEAASGVSIRNQWEAGNIGSAVALIVNGKRAEEQARSSLEGALYSAERAVKTLTAVLNTVPAADEGMNGGES